MTAVRVLTRHTAYQIALTAKLRNSLRRASLIESRGMPKEELAAKTGNALVYCGKGAGTRSILSALESLKKSLHPSILVGQITPEQLLASDWQQGCLVLVMPGGADLPYCQALNGQGNKLIRDYVDSGGAYLGLCAGAYYACARIEFELGTRLEVKGARELAFFPGVARGGVYPGFQYMSEAGAVAAPISVCSSPQRPRHDAPDSTAHTSSSNGQQLDEQEQDTNTLGDGACFFDYSNGGPCFVTEHDQAKQDEDGHRHLQSHAHGGRRVTALARYCDLDHAVAAVSCDVGGGRAVLCGTHPELAPHWLGAADAAAESKGRVEVGCRDKAASVRAQLEQTQAQRVDFWHTLLHACRVQLAA